MSVHTNRLVRSLLRKRAIEAAAIQYHGWGRDRRTDNKLSPEAHWEASTKDQRRACIELTTPIIEAYERVMGGGA
jgi:hypothetical protein